MITYIGAIIRAFITKKRYFLDGVDEGATIGDMIFNISCYFTNSVPN